ncbi:hypothetical protein JQR84_23925 (plasmid) [Pseudomonas luteola]|uniref:hypothetical protein n=1 Tax=Pseudomonas TaxID=286 RepID=UPI003D9FCAD9
MLEDAWMGHVVELGDVMDLLAQKGYGRIMSRESPKVWGFHHWIIFGASTW